MATIVQHDPSGSRYVLVGSGYGQWYTERQGRAWAALAVNVKSGTTEMLCVCDGAGCCHWLSTDEVTVVSVDGVSPGEVLG